MNFKKKSLTEYLKTLLDLFLIFFKIGLFTFGGGYAMLSLLEDEVVEKKSWISKAELANIFAIAESTPGPIAVNTATFVGYKKAGVVGGIIATLGVTIPSFVIIIIVSYIIDFVKDNIYVQNIFKGIRIGVLVLIFRAVFTFFKSIKKDIVSILLLIASFFIVFFTDINIIYIILASFLIGGMVASFINYRNNHKYHMLNTPEYYSQKTGKVLDEDEYYSEVAEKLGLVKIKKEDRK